MARTDHDAPASTAWRIERAALLRTSLVVATAVAVYGLSFGALAVAAGFSLAQTCAMSLFMFNGASQLAFVGTLGAGGSMLVAVASALLIGARNASYGVRLAPLLGIRGLRRMLAAVVTVDESTALAMANERADDRGRAGRFGFWSAGVAVYLLWNLTTVIGAIAAQHLGDPRALGLDSAIAAGLAALVWPSLRDAATRRAAAVAALVAIALTPVAPAGVPVILAGLVAVAVVVRVDRALPSRSAALPRDAFGTAA